MNATCTHLDAVDDVTFLVDAAPSYAHS